LLALSGGHAGLTKTVLSLLANEPKRSLTDVAPTLADRPEVQAECRKVWDGLAEAEQLALCVLGRQGPVDADTLERLERRGLARGKPRPAIFAPLFAEFARQQGATAGGGHGRQAQPAVSAERRSAHRGPGRAGIRATVCALRAPGRGVHVRRAWRSRVSEMLERRQAPSGDSDNKMLYWKRGWPFLARRCRS
jgi:hypothetical protein